jgi:hypothetical protein
MYTGLHRCLRIVSITGLTYGGIVESLRRAGTIP